MVGGWLLEFVRGIGENFDLGNFLWRIFKSRNILYWVYREYLEWIVEELDSFIKWFYESFLVYKEKDILILF